MQNEMTLDIMGNDSKRIKLGMKWLDFDVYIQLCNFKLHCPTFNFFKKTSFLLL